MRRAVLVAPAGSPFEAARRHQATARAIAQECAEEAVAHACEVAAELMQVAALGDTLPSGVRQRAELAARTLMSHADELQAIIRRTAS